MKRKSIIFILFVATLMFVLSGCIEYNEPNQISQIEQEEGNAQSEVINQEEGPEEGPEEEQEEEQEVQGEVEENNIEVNNVEEDNLVVDPNPKTEDKEITLYFMDKAVVETGQGDYSELIKETRTIRIDNRPLELIVLEELQNGPTSNEGLTMIRKDLQIVSVEVADSIAYVNLSSQNLHGGSLEETGVLLQVGYSLTELDNVDKVQFLVDGTKRESLMGHYTIQEPWTRDMIQ